jgi:predicted component of type VI protein secretion system
MNGTKLNGQSLTSEEPAPLKPQDTIKIGNQGFRVGFRAAD